MELLTALAAISDVKDFRMRELARSQGMDPSQPSLFYRALIKEARQAVMLESALERCRSRTAALEAELAEVRGESEAALRSARKAAQDWHRQTSEAEQRMEGLQQHVEALESHLIQAEAVTASWRAVIPSLVEFLAGDNSPEVLKSIYYLGSALYNEALRRAILGQAPVPLDDADATRMRAFLRNQLRGSLALSREEYLYARFYGAIWAAKCATCGQEGCLPDQEIVWTHVQCPESTSEVGV